MIRILLGAALGYVLGTKAGRERYDEILRACQRVVDHPAVQGVAGAVRTRFGTAVDQRDDHGPDRNGRVIALPRR